MGDIYECRSSFCAEVNGQRAIVRRGDTVREGHPLITRHPSHFTLLVPRFEYVAPKSPPPAKKAAAAPTKPAGVKAD
jgi:hypothetical protein